MPTIIQPDDMQVSEQGPGWRVVTLAATDVAGMEARRWLLDSGAHTPEMTHGDVDQLLYVIRGSGQAIANGEVMLLDPEAMLWLEPGDRYAFVAGHNGLEILQGHSPDSST